MIDWDAPAPPGQARDLAQAARGGRMGAGGSREAQGPRDARERIERLRASLGERTRRSTDLDDRLVANALTALDKGAEPEAAYSWGELIALEAVILTDGSRPSLTVEEGFVDTFAAQAGDWGYALRRFEGPIRDVLGAVGRVNAPVSPRLAGTAFRIAPDLCLTNRHVAEIIAHRTGGAWRLNWPVETTIAFQGETGVRPDQRCEVLEVVYAGPEPTEFKVDFHRLDMAVLRIRSEVASEPVTLSPGGSAATQGRNVYVVGFPAHPLEHFDDTPPPPCYETSAVIASVFLETFGVKKLAPGRILAAAGELEDDPRRWVMAHDASTLCGNSGSAVVDLDINGGQVLGLHFAGVSRVRNYGHDLAALRRILEPLGARYPSDG